MHRLLTSHKIFLRGSALTLALTAWALPSPGRAMQAYPLAARASAQVVQNTTGNAYALQAGLAPRLRLERVPVGLKLLLEYGALRDTQRHLFSVPSAQALLEWAIAPRLEVALGAGAQFWFAPAGPLARPIVTLEAHYVPPHKLWRVARSAFVASSLGASGTAGLQVRAGIEFDLHPVPAAPTGGATADLQTSHASELCPPVAPCPPCPPCPPQQAPTPSAARAVKIDRPLGEHITFAYNITTLDGPGQQSLSQLAQRLVSSAADWQALAITGHASARGTEAQNLTVSWHRAQHVAQALVAHGVPAHKLTVHGLGESAPMPGYAPNDAAQQCVVLELVGVSPEGPLKDLITSPTPSEEQQP